MSLDNSDVLLITSSDNSCFPDSSSAYCTDTLVCVARSLLLRDPVMLDGAGLSSFMNAA